VTIRGHISKPKGGPRKKKNWETVL